MTDFGLREVPPEVLATDVARFHDGVIDVVTQHSGHMLDAAVVRRYCEWFVGSDYGWTWTSGDRWSDGYRTEWMMHLGAHLGGMSISAMDRCTLHMRSKRGTWRGSPFHWTRYVAFDLDSRPNQSTSVAARYLALVNALDVEPVVVSSPRGGVHAYVALTSPMSLFGLTQSKRDAALIPALLARRGLRIAPRYIELFPSNTHTLRLPLGPGTVQLDPRTLTPLSPVSRVAEVARLVDAMEGQLVWH